MNESIPKQQKIVEYLCDLIPAMWAERLFDGSFEGPLPYDFQFMGARDMKDHPWYPDGQVNRAEYVNDESNAVTGKVAKKIAVGCGVASFSVEGVGDYAFGMEATADGIGLHADSD